MPWVIEAPLGPRACGEVEESALYRLLSPLDTPPMLRGKAVQSLLLARLMLPSFSLSKEILAPAALLYLATPERSACWHYAQKLWVISARREGWASRRSSVQSKRTRRPGMVSSSDTGEQS